jgi:hypothetical protein
MRRPSAGPVPHNEGEIRMSAIAYSIPQVGKQFTPALSLRLVRLLIAQGIFRPITLGRRKYILHDEIVEALRAIGSETK